MCDFFFLLTCCNKGIAKFIFLTAANWLVHYFSAAFILAGAHVRLFHAHRARAARGGASVWGEFFFFSCPLKRSRGRIKQNGADERVLSLTV